MPSTSTLGLIILLPIFPGVFYLLTLAKALRRCSPRNRSMSPRHVWMLLIPVFNFLWHFVVVMDVTDSVDGEMRRRKFRAPNPQQQKLLGLAMCVLFPASILPLIGPFAFVGAVVSWILFWIRVTDSSRKLERRVKTSIVVG